MRKVLSTWWPLSLAAGAFLALLGVALMPPLSEPDRNTLLAIFLMTAVPFTGITYVQALRALGARHRREKAALEAQHAREKAAMAAEHRRIRAGLAAGSGSSPTSTAGSMRTTSSSRLSA